MKKCSISKYIADIIVDGAKKILITIGVILLMIVTLFVIIAAFIAALFVVGFIANMTSNIVHGVNLYHGNNNFCTGFILAIPTVVTLACIQFIREVHRWLRRRWYVSSGCISIKEQCTEFNKGDHVWLVTNTLSQYLSKGECQIFESQEHIVAGIVIVSEYDFDVFIYPVD